MSALDDRLGSLREKFPSLVARTCRARVALVVLLASSACVLVSLVVFPVFFPRQAWGYRLSGLGHSYPQTVVNVFQDGSTQQIYDCQDAYRLPGYLYIDRSNYRSTRWIPYSSSVLSAPPPSSAAYPPPASPDVFFDATAPPSSLLDSPTTPRSWMTLLVREDRRRRALVDPTTPPDNQSASDFLALRDGSGFGWLWGRRVLLVGDSVDRFMVQFTCEELSRRMAQPAPHTTASCHVPAFNLTLVHWHSAGSFTYRPAWWWMGDMGEVAFEERWEKLWSPTLASDLAGPRGRPDLILYQNGLWDQRALWESAQARLPDTDPMYPHERQLAFSEVQFLVARLDKFAQQLTSAFGPSAPVMFRAVTTHRNSSANDANLYEIDRISRALAARAGHEVFEWGRILTSFSMLFRDQTHVGKGPGSWLWGNMVLEYLARSAGAGGPGSFFDGWEACHGDLIDWGGR